MVSIGSYSELEFLFSYLKFYEFEDNEVDVNCFHLRDANLDGVNTDFNVCIHDK